MKSDFQVLLYYKYIHLPNAKKLRDEQKALCEKLQLKGRIIVADEGINGTVEGTVENTEKYMAAMENSQYFSEINYKKSVGTGNAFKKLSVKYRPEVVTSKVAGLDPTKVTGKYITADELHRWYEEAREFYVVDMRNEYEYQSGYFEGFIGSGMKNFFHLQEVLPNLSHLKDKPIVTVCTGGIRCEKASGFLVMNGFTNVYQLKDGIATYLEKYPNGYFKGKLYVFDNRLTLDYGNSSEVVGKCDLCGATCDRYVNCAYNECHRHFICCDGCLDKELNLPFCNASCREKYLEKTIHHRNNSKSVFF